MFATIFKSANAVKASVALLLVIFPPFMVMLPEKAQVPSTVKVLPIS
jgi:hypothetical protein